MSTNTFLWMIQGVLAAVFLFSGVMKATMPREWLVAHKQTGVGHLAGPLIKFIGIVEILGAAGIILPWALGIQPWLTPATAIGFCIIMLLAAPIHHRLKEPQNVAINVGLFMLSAVVAIRRMMELMA